MRRATYALGLTVSIVLAVAATALAGGDGIVIVQNGARASDDTPTLTADCSSSDEVLAGGFRLRTGDNIAQQDEPAGGGGWKVEALTDAGAHVHAYALCEPASARKLKIVSKSVTVPAGTGSPVAVSKDVGQAGVTARCADGWQAVSGGYAVIPPFAPDGNVGEVAVDTNKRAGSSGWRVHGANEGDPTDLKAIAVCEKQSESQIHQVSKTVPIELNGKGVIIPVGTDAVAKCPKHSHVVGGGFRSKPSQGQNGMAFPEVSASMPKSKTSWAAHYSAHVSGSITSYAECEKG